MADNPGCPLTNPIARGQVAFRYGSTQAVVVVAIINRPQTVSCEAIGVVEVAAHDHAVPIGGPTGDGLADGIGQVVGIAVIVRRAECSAVVVVPGLWRVLRYRALE